MTTGFVWHERYMWHDTGSALGEVSTRGRFQPGPHVEHPETKRRLKNLLDAYAVTPTLTAIEPFTADEEILRRFHTADYLARLEALSRAGHGDAGETAPVGLGSWEIARLAVGGAIAAADAVLDARVHNAYVLARPPGHHAERDRGMGFCLLGNIALTILDLLARRRLQRVAVVDWDVHHGNGTQQAFWDHPDVLTLSLHQDQLYPQHSGTHAEIGAGPGEGLNINVPLPPGSGGGAWLTAMDRVVLPALETFEPDLVVIACGFDASFHDPLSHSLLLSVHYAEMMERIMAAARHCCDGRVLVCHEGGYSDYYVPLCGVATIDVLRGGASGIRDPFTGGDALDVSWQALQPHQEAMIQRAVDGPLALLQRRCRAA